MFQKALIVWGLSQLGLETELCAWACNTISKVGCIALHCNALHCTALHCTSLHCTSLFCQIAKEAAEENDKTSTTTTTESTTTPEAAGE
jgi:hypothetical protein